MQGGDRDLAMHMKVLQLAVGSVLSDKAGKAFDKAVKSLTQTTE